MEVKTGYFARMKDYIELGYYPVSVARYNPKGMKLFTWSGVSPNANLFSRYKQGKVTEAQYESEYLEQLKAYHLDKDLAYLEELFENNFKTNYNGYILLCYEKSGSFCHRHILGKYISSNFNYSVQEVIL